jgi:phosphatidylglycerophosphate synthase
MRGSRAVRESALEPSPDEERTTRVMATAEEPPDVSPPGVLYLASADDLEAGCASVRGLPVAYRAVMTALRAGCPSVAVPAQFRGTAVERAVRANPRARRATRWLHPGEAWVAPSPVLLLPATVILPVDALRPLFQGPSPAVLAASPDAAPVTVADSSVTGDLVPDITAGRPIGDALRASLRAHRAESVRGGWCVRALTESDRRRAERRLEAALGSVIDSWLDTVLHRRVSRLFTRWAVEVGLSPNMVSLFSLAVGLAAVWCWTRATLAGATLGLVLYFVSVVLDHTDGEVARLTFAESRLGEWLDASVDTVVHVLGALALGLAAERVGGRGLLLGALAALGFVACALVAKTSPRPIPGHGLMGAVSAIGTRDGFYLLLLLFILVIGVAPAGLPWLVLVAALGSHAYWFGALAVRWRHHTLSASASRDRARRGLSPG